MPRFYYQAVDRTGRRVNGSEEAQDQASLVVSLQAKGLFVVRWLDEPAPPRRLWGRTSRGIGTTHRREFITELAQLLKAGVPVDRALRILADSTRFAAVRRLASDIREAVRAGASLSEAVAQRAPEFGELTVSMIRAGEVGGVLDEVLEKLGNFLTRSEEIRKFILTSSLYPMLLLLMGIGSAAALLGFVIPKFAVVFQDLGSNVPWATRALMGLSEVFRKTWWLGPLGGVAAFVAARALLKRPAYRAFCDRWLLQMPALGSLIRDVELGRWARTLGTLLVSGVPLLKALAVARDVVRNRLIQEALTVVYQKVQQGKSMSSLLMETKVFPARLVHLSAIGEETGRLGEMLLAAADDLDSVVQVKTRAYLGLLEPVIIVGMGILIGAMVISMLVAVMGIQEISF